MLKQDMCTLNQFFYTIEQPHTFTLYGGEIAHCTLGHRHFRNYGRLYAVLPNLQENAKCC